MASSARRYATGSLTRGRRIVAGLRERFPGTRERVRAASRTYLDSFDWRLHHAGGALAAAEEGGFIRLRWQHLDGTTRRTLRVATLPAFASDLPAGSMRAALSKVLSVRRLLPVASVEGQTQGHRILDGSGKTLVRVALGSGRARDPAGSRGSGRLPAVLEITALKGYDIAFRRVVSYLEDEIGLEPTAESELDLALAAFGRKARDYRAKPDPRLRADLPADAALRAILGHLLEVIEVNEDGVRRDLDPEFLHDFRVAVRRTRSALSQMRGVLPPRQVTRFHREFSWLGEVTGPSRDLDVYLIKLPVYAAGLPAETRREIEPLATFLRRQQRLAHRRLVRSLDSKRFRRLLAEWRDFLDSPSTGGDGTPNGALPILPLASRRIWKRYRRVIRDGLAVGPDTPADRVHRLRIDCKKLRYLLEFFRSLYDPEGVSLLIRALKSLQDRLGDFNDYQVQQEALATYGRRMARAGAATPETLLAMGRLLDRLALAQAAERERIVEQFSRFSRRRNRAHFRRLFKASPQGSS